MTDRQGKPLQKYHRPLMMMASEKSMTAKADLTRGVMTLQQTEQWHFITAEPMKALRKPLVNFPDCTTASQCIGPIDVPNPEDAWKVTVAAKKKIYGEDGLIRPHGPTPGRCSQDQDDDEADAPSAASMGMSRPRRTSCTIEPVTWHGTSGQAWDEILNIAGANNPFPKMVLELTATEDTLAFKCLQHHVPYLGICFNDYHRTVLRQRLAQLVFEAMMDKDSAFGTVESSTALRCLSQKDDSGGGDGLSDDDDDDPAATETPSKAKAKAKGKVEAKRKKRQQAGAATKKLRESAESAVDDEEAEEAGTAASAAAVSAEKRKKLLETLDDTDDDADDEDNEDKDDDA